MNNANKKVMTLVDAREKLEREGLSCDFVMDQLLVGVSSKCRWELTAKVDVMVFVQEVRGVLTRERFLEDLQLLPSWVKQLNVGGGDCPPLGFAHGRFVMLVYYAEAIDPGFGYEIRHVARPREWGASTFVAAQDSQGQSFNLVKPRPCWGFDFYQEEELRYYAQKLTGANDEHLQPPLSPRWILVLRILNSLSICVIIFLCITQPWHISGLVIYLLVHFLIIQCRRS
jgi:hypothetical protein